MVIGNITHFGVDLFCVSTRWQLWPSSVQDIESARSEGQDQGGSHVGPTARMPRRIVRADAWVLEAQSRRQVFVPRCVCVDVSTCVCVCVCVCVSECACTWCFVCRCVRTAHVRLLIQDRACTKHAYDVDFFSIISSSSIGVL